MYIVKYVYGSGLHKNSLLLYVAQQWRGDVFDPTGQGLDGKKCHMWSDMYCSPNGKMFPITSLSIQTQRQNKFSF